MSLPIGIIRPVADESGLIEDGEALILPILTNPREVGGSPEIRLVLIPMGSLAGIRSTAVLQSGDYLGLEEFLKQFLPAGVSI